MGAGVTGAAGMGHGGPLLSHSAGGLYEGRWAALEAGP